MTQTVDTFYKNKLFSSKLFSRRFIFQYLTIRYEKKKRQKTCFYATFGCFCSYFEVENYFLINFFKFAVDTFELLLVSSMLTNYGFWTPNYNCLDSPLVTVLFTLNIDDVELYFLLWCRDIFFKSDEPEMKYKNMCFILPKKKKSN